MDDRLCDLDQGAVLGLRAFGRQPLFIGTWWYDRPVDLVALEAFVARLNRGILGRYVRRSSIWTGRDRWVLSDEPPRVEVFAVPISRADVVAWADRLADRPLDIEHGPAWRVGVQPLIGGGAVVAIVVPHTLGDGLCKLQAFALAASGQTRDLGLTSGQQRWPTGLRDACDVVRSVPEQLRAVRASFALARHRAQIAPAASAAAPSTDRSGPAYAARAEAEIDIAQWDECAARLGGSSNALFAAVSARLAVRLDRVLVDDTVALVIPVSTRTAADTRANALESATAVVDPAGLTDDLRPVREAIRAARAELERTRHLQVGILPLARLLPLWLARLLERAVMGAAAAPVGCSNYGDVDPQVAKIDGASAVGFTARVRERFASEAELERLGGQLYLLSGRSLGSVFITVLSHQAGQVNTDEAVTAALQATLAEFGLANEFAVPARRYA